MECGRSRETVRRPGLAGWAEYGYCASHSRFFWGLRLHLVCAPQGLPIAFALTGAKADERELSEHGVQLLRRARKGERERPGAALLKPLRQVIESIKETFKGQLDLERHRGRTPAGVIARGMQRILALTAATWHNDAAGQTVLRSLSAYDH